VLVLVVVVVVVLLVVLLRYFHLHGKRTKVHGSFWYIYMFVGLRAYVWYICGCWPLRLCFLQVLETSQCRGGAAKIFNGF
jgi:hypothetical protein